MANTFIVYPNETGSTTDYSVPFEYLSSEFVKATVDGVSAPFTFLSTYMIRFEVAPVGRLKIYRETQKDELINTYEDGSILIDDDLNASFLQSLHVAEEVAESSLQQNISGDWSALNLRVVDVADPEDSSDAANKEYVDSRLAQDVAEVQADRIAAETAKDLAVQAKDGADVSAANAGAAASFADSRADSAEVWATEARKWAEENVDVEVEPGAYSAKHWAEKAEEAVGLPGTAGATGTDVFQAETEDDGRQALGIIVPTLISSAPPTSPFDIPVVTKSDMLVTVGPGGNYATINEAVEALSYYMPAYVQRGMQAEIRLLSGFVMAEQVQVHGQNYCWMMITSEDSEVPIQSAALTSMGGSYRPAFRVEEGGGLPMINALFNMDNSGSENNYAGVQILGNGYARVHYNAGVKNAGARGVHCISGMLYAQQSIFDGAGDIGFRLGNNSVASIRAASAQNCGGSGARIAGASMVLAQRSNFSGCAQDGINLDDTSRVDALELIAENCGDAAIGLNGPASIDAPGAVLNGSAFGVYCTYGGRANVSGAEVKNCTNRALLARHGGDVIAQNAICTGGANGIWAADGSRIMFVNGDASGSLSGDDIIVARGSFITAHGSTGTRSQNVNEVTNHGIIFG